MSTLETYGLAELSRQERLELLGLLWDSLTSPVPLSDARKAELARRVAEDDANPDDTVSWDEARAATLRRLGS